MKYFRSIGSSFLLTNYDEINWSFTVVHGTQVWEGFIKNEKIEKSASDIHQSVAEYTETMKSIFSGLTDKVCVELKMADDKPTELSWKKVTTSGVKFSLGTVILKLSETISIDGVFREIATYVADLNLNLYSHKQQLDDANTYSKGLTEKLTLLGDMKTQLESELFTKFVLILNEKKDKIRSLKQEITTLKNEMPASEDTAKESGGTSNESDKVKCNVASSKIANVRDDDVDAGFISMLPKRETKKRVSSKKSSKTSKRTRTRLNYEVSSDNDDDETVDADELLNDL